MTQLPTINMKLQEFGLNEKLEAYNKARAEINITRQLIQDEIMDFLWDNYSIDPNLWFYNPEETYFRMVDHKERKLPTQHYVKILLNKNDPGASVMNIKIGSHEPTVCKNINTLVETMQLHVYLLQALKNPELQKLISNGYLKITQEIQQKKDIHKYHEAARDAQYLIQAAEYCSMMSNVGINTREELNDWLNTMNAEQVKQITNFMGLQSLTSQMFNKKQLIKTINHFYCIPNK